MHPTIPALALALTLATTAPAQAAQTPPATSAPQPKPALVPPDFPVPTHAEAPTFQLAPLGPSLVKIDFEAYMSSVEHLRKTFSRSPSWPHAGISDADAMADMQAEQARFHARTSFAYSILTPDRRRERGSLYVSPSPVPGYDAVVRIWVTKADYDAGFDAEAYTWAQAWIARAWPFHHVAWPGRAIAWDQWDAMVAAAKAAKPTP